MAPDQRSWADYTEDEEPDDLPQSWTSSEVGSSEQPVYAANEGRTAFETSPPEWPPAHLQMPPSYTAQYQPDEADTLLSSSAAAADCTADMASSEACFDNLPVKATPDEYTAVTSLLTQEYSPSDAYGFWLGQQEPYMQALLRWHDAEAQIRANFQSQWVSAWSQHSPADFLYECCDEGVSVPLCQQPGYSFPSREAYYYTFQPQTPYIIAPLPQEAPHEEGQPRVVGVWHVPHEAVNAPVIGTTKPIMIIDSKVHILDPSHSIAAAAGMHQPRFCSFEPGQLQPLEELDIEPPSTMTRCTIQDMRASFASGGTVSAALSCEGAEVPPQPVGTGAVAAEGTSYSDSLVDEILVWGDHLQHVSSATCEEKEEPRSTYLSFCIAADARSGVLSNHTEAVPAAQQQPPQEPFEAAAEPSLLGSLVSAAVLAGCVAGAIAEEALDAGPRAARMVLGQPEPACGSLGVRLVRQAARAGYRAAGIVTGAVAAAGTVVAWSK